MQKFLSLEEIFLECKRLFLSHEIISAQLDASLLIQHFAEVSLVDIFLHPHKMLPPQVVEKIRQAALERISGKTVHRIIGFREFYSLSLDISDFTLEPRQDTEVLVDSVLPFVRMCVEEKGGCKILDLGTGTGAIGLALLSQEVGCEVVASDISQEALAVAQRNAVRLGLSDRFSLVHANWFENISGKYDLIVSNPPYIRSAEIPYLSSEVYGCDPLLALDGGVDGLQAYRMIAQAFSYLQENGRVAVEIGWDQAQEVDAIFSAASFEKLGVYSDLGGHDRVIVFRDCLKRSWQIYRESI